MSKTQLFSKIRHHDVLKMDIVISNDSLRESKSSDDMIEYEKCCNFSSVIECRHRLDPFSEIICGYDDVSMPLVRVRVTCHEVNAPFCERTNENYRV
jgi:hypothetical protein